MKTLFFLYCKNEEINFSFLVQLSKLFVHMYGHYVFYLKPKCRCCQYLPFDQKSNNIKWEGIKIMGQEDGGNMVL